MLGAILAGIALGAATLISLTGGKRPQPQPVRIKTKDRKNAENQ